MNEEDRLIEVKEEGATAAMNHKGHRSCPYHTDLYKEQWLKGWLEISGGYPEEES